MKIATDLDGVLSTFDLQLFRATKFNRKEYYESRPYTKFLHDNPNKIIITGRKKKYEIVTRLWLRKNNVRYSEIFFLPNEVQKTRKNQIKFKSEVIKYKGIQKYYEDDYRIYKALKKSCDCEVVLVKS